MDRAGCRNGWIAPSGIHRIGQQRGSKEAVGEVIPTPGDAEVVEAETVNQPELVR